MAHYFLGNRLLASSPQPSWWSDEQVSSASLVFVCPTCGDVWGRVVEEGKQWLPVRSGCNKHPWLDEVGGSFIAPWRQTFAELPAEVLQYEARIRFNQLKD